MTIEKSLHHSVAASLPRDGLRADQVEAMINRHMELDMPLSQDLGR